jgi:sigma-B regulation protein RsbU (phosphoserine phosphatase)
LFVARKPTEGPPFEDLLDQLRAYVAEMAGETGVTRTLKQLEAAHARTQRPRRPEADGSAGASARSDSPDPLIKPLRDDLEKAQTVVNKLMPSQPPSLPGFDLAVYNRSCHEVGGDYYDFINLPDDRVALVIADVSGKGFGAALIMAMLREVLHIAAANQPTVAKAVAVTNRLLVPDMPRGMFVTMLYGIIHPAKREMSLVNAGHCPPIIWRPRLTGARVLNLRGPAIGVLDAERFADGIRQKTLPLEPGDCLCFFTDGISEAKDLLGEEFGGQRLAQVLRDHATEPASKISEAIIAAVDEHTKGAAQHDDMTLVVLRVTPDAPALPAAKGD